MTAAADEPQRRFSALRLLGPAFVASIAYVDPGNVAANVTAGAKFGYLLVWVLVAANLMAVVVQYLSAKLGLVTGLSLPQLLGASLDRWPRRLYWLQAEAVAAATDVAEVIGGAIALHLLFGLPLLVGGAIVGLVSMALLSLQSNHGQRTFEFVIMGLLAIITLGFVAGLVFTSVDTTAAARGLIPRFAGTESVIVAASMLGATVMPHAVYVHSALARDRHGRQRGSHLGRLLSATRWDVGLSLLLAGSVNIAMLLVAAASLQGVANTDSIDGAHAAIGHALGPVVAALFAVGLLASGLASTSVGCYAGSTIMAGLLKYRVPLLARRALTLVPALGILALGVDPTWALVMSQVVLSLGIPFAIIPLVVLTARRRTMGEHANSPILNLASWVIVALIVALNGLLLGLMLAG